MTYDKENMLDILQAFPEQCKEAIRLVRGFKIKGKFDSICVCGMGGSGIGGDLLKSLAKKTLVFAHHSYGLPNFVNKKSLVFVISYSGNTEETLSAYEEAKKRKAKIIAITSGGKLAEKVKDAVIIPGGLQPRASLGYLFLTMVAILSSNGLIPGQSAAMNEAIRLLIPKQISKEAFMMTKKLIGKIPVFYASDDLEAVAYRMKTQINENAKQPAFYHVFPEMNHNEINGFKKLGNKIIAVFIRDDKDLNKVKKRMDITKKLLKSQTSVIDMPVKGNSLLARMLYAIYIGDFASYYLALMNKLDPSPVPIIEDLKKRL
ncbi:bifunctional phosphoglucose/phosphomannose isomerase [Candidatus Woesearchaeota archaeon]|nr:bifunctional phosphoglucose/phosphomannose isomerase [Candidatus Woesearchaeota archaeon]